MFDAVRVVCQLCKVGLIVPKDVYLPLEQKGYHCPCGAWRESSRNFFRHLRAFRAAGLRVLTQTGWFPAYCLTYRSSFFLEEGDFPNMSPEMNHVLARDMVPSGNYKLASITFTSNRETNPFSIEIWDQTALLAHPSNPRRRAPQDGRPDFRGVALYAKEGWFAKHWPIPDPSQIQLVKLFLHAAIQYNREWQLLFEQPNFLTVCPVQSGHLPANGPLGEYFRRILPNSEVYRSG